MPDSDRLSLYTLGLQARDYSASVMERADVVIALGYDFVEYAPCFWNPDRNKHIVHIDPSPAEVDEHYIVDVGLLGDIRLALGQIAPHLEPFGSAWVNEARATVVDGFAAELQGGSSGPIRPQWLMKELRAALGPDDLIICDVGAHKLWMARMFPCEIPNSCIISNGFAAMGMAVPSPFGEAAAS